MPPKKPPAKQPPPTPSKSRALVTTGPKEIVVRKSHSKRDVDGHKPTTVWAMTLRNGKNGTMGTGEVMLSTKISGREKLELLAEDLISRYRQALATPFSAEKAIHIAEAQFTAYTDEIHNLQDPILFHHAIKAEATARKPQTPPVSGKRKQQRKDPLTDPNFIGSVVSSRIHNTYLFASAWRLVGLTLTETVDIGEDSRIRDRLSREPNFRAQYLVLYDLVNILVNTCQQKFAQLATTAPHWNQYFKENANKEPDQSEPEYVFSWENLKSVHKSFLDSIVVELCLPESVYPKQILLHILHEAIDETPRDAKRFPQELWDAMGDFSSTVQLLDLLETPLMGTNGEKWKKETRQMPEEYENWVDAQIFSEKASKEYANFQNMLVPIDTELKKPAIVQTVWKYINLNYQGVCGKSIDALWQLDDLVYRKPSWHARKAVEAKANSAHKDADDDDSDGPPGLSAFGGKKKSRKPLAITSSGYDSTGSMPSLQTVSESSDAEEEFDDEDGLEEANESEAASDDEDERYDEDEEDHLREMLREAMDVATADPDFYNPRRDATDFKDMAEDRKGNPFIKLLGSLRGRMFNANPNLKSAGRAEPRQPYTGSKPPSSAYTPVQPSAAKPTTKTPKASQPKTQKATVEEVSDDDEASTAAKKKKKKKPKKKRKPATAGANGAEGDTEETVRDAAEEAPPPMSPTPTAATLSAPTSPAAKKTPATPKSPKPHAARAASVKSITSTLPAYASTASLPLPTEQTAQSARSYLRTEGLAGSEKAKIKRRGDQPTMFSVPEKKRTIFSRFTGKKEEPQEKSGDKYSFLSKMTKKTKTYMHQLLHSTEDEKQGIAPLKWEHFLKVMREMGFSYDPSTAGSSVRFDPPDPRDPSITFHKPHPDPTLQPWKVREFGRRLTRQYGWSEEDFYNKMNSRS